MQLAALRVQWGYKEVGGSMGKQGGVGVDWGAECPSPESLRTVQPRMSGDIGLMPPRAPAPPGSRSRFTLDSTLHAWREHV